MRRTQIRVQLPSGLILFHRLGTVGIIRGTAAAVLFGIALMGVKNAEAASDPTLSPDNVTVTGITRSSAIVNYSSSQNGQPFASGTQVLFGTAPQYGYVMNMGGSYSVHSVALTGLAPDTTYYYCAQVVDPADSSHVSPCDGTTNNYSFHTLAVDQPSGSTTPNLPAAGPDTSMPPVTGTVANGTFAVASNCGDLQENLNAAAAQSDADGLNYQVVIPAGMKCTGAFSAPARQGSGTGWVIVRTSTPDSQLPPPGTRITPAQQKLLATIVDDSWWTFDGGISEGGGCLTNEIAEPEGILASPPRFDVLVCNNGTWTPASLTGTATSASDTPPPSCSTGQWWFNPYQEYAFRRVWYCVSDNNFINMNFRNDYGNKVPQNLWGSGLIVEANASRYRFVGLEITDVPTPGVAVTYPDMNYDMLVSVDSSADHIIFDRMYLHGNDAPTKTNTAVGLDGSNEAIIDSYIDNINAWYQPNTNGENNGTGILIGYGPGPDTIRNNYIDAVGIGLFSADDGSAVGVNLTNPPSDITVVNNYFHIDPKYDSGSSASNGYVYTNRNMLELKYGLRWLIQGNIFDGNFGYTNQGPAITLTARPNSYSFYNTETTATISDITIKDNLFKNMPSGLLIGGVNGSPQYPQPIAERRVQIKNNLFQNIDGNIAAPGNAGNSTNGAIADVLGGPTDIVFDHNTIYRNFGSFPADFIFDPLVPYADGVSRDAVPGVNLQFTNNIANVTWNDCWGLSASGDIAGTAAVNGTFFTRSSTITPSWTVGGNGFVSVSPGSSSCSSEYPAGNVPAQGDAPIFDAGYNNAAAGDYSLASSSPFKNGGTDGKDPGVNMTELAAAIANTLTGGAESGASNPAIDGPVLYNINAQLVDPSTTTITWSSDWAATTQVQYGLTAGYGQTTAETDTQTGPCFAYGSNPGDVCSIGTGSHKVTLSGLQPNATYHYAVVSRDERDNSVIRTTVSADHTFTTGGFVVSASPSSRSVGAGGTTSYTINVSAAGGLSGPVTLTANGLPAGVTAVFTPNTIQGPGSAATSTLVLSTPSGITSGSYPFTVAAQWGATTQTMPLRMAATAPQQSFSVTPNSGSGASQTFTFTAKNLTGMGASRFAQAQMKIAGANGTGACYLMYRLASGGLGKGLYLADDEGTQFMGPVTPGGNGTLSNSQCSVSAAGVTVSVSGANLGIQVPLVFSQTFAGSANMSMEVYDATGNGSGWSTVGQWNVSQ